MAVINNAQCFVASAPGTGTITLGNSPTGWAHWANVGAVSGQQYGYRLDDGNNWEIGIGTYTASGNPLTYTLTRGALYSSGGTINASAAAVVTQVATSFDFLIPSRNRIINGNFGINQRGNPSASTSYSAGVYIMDRWKAGSSGVTMSFATAANGADVVVSITAGSLVQVVEGALYLQDGGPFSLSWQGTAIGRAYQGSTAPGFVSGGAAVNASFTAGTNVTVEFTGGTVSLAQLEPGIIQTTFERTSPTIELLRAQRYFFAGAIKGPVGGNNYGTWTPVYIGGCVDLPVAMAYAPNLSFYDFAGAPNAVSGGNGNGNTIANGGLGQKYNQLIFMDALLNSSQVTYWWGCLFQASAEL